jgi:hypothetical protein
MRYPFALLWRSDEAHKHRLEQINRFMLNGPSLGAMVSRDLARRHEAVVAPKSDEAAA